MNTLNKITKKQLLSSAAACFMAANSISEDMLGILDESCGMPNVIGLIDPDKGQEILELDKMFWGHLPKFPESDISVIFDFFYKVSEYCGSQENASEIKSDFYDVFNGEDLLLNGLDIYKYDWQRIRDKYNRAFDSNMAYPMQHPPSHLIEKYKTMIYLYDYMYKHLHTLWRLSSTNSLSGLEGEIRRMLGYFQSFDNDILTGCIVEMQKIIDVVEPIFEFEKYAESQEKGENNE